MARFGELVSFLHCQEHSSERYDRLALIVYSSLSLALTIPSDSLNINRYRKHSWPPTNSWRVVGGRWCPGFYRRLSPSRGWQYWSWWFTESCDQYTRIILSQKVSQLWLRNLGSFPRRVETANRGRYTRTTSSRRTCASCQGSSKSDDSTNVWTTSKRWFVWFDSYVQWYLGWGPLILYEMTTIFISEFSVAHWQYRSLHHFACIIEIAYHN